MRSAKCVFKPMPRWCAQMQAYMNGKVFHSAVKMKWNSTRVESTYGAIITSIKVKYSKRG